MQIWNIDAVEAGKALLAPKSKPSYMGVPLSQDDLARRERYLRAESEVSTASLMRTILAERRGGNLTFPVEIYFESQRGSLMMLGDALPLVMSHEKALPMVQRSRVFWEEFLMAARQLNEGQFKHALSFHNIQGSPSFARMAISGAGRMGDGVAAAMAHECEAWVTQPIVADHNELNCMGATAPLLRLSLMAADNRPWSREDVLADGQEQDRIYAKREAQARSMLRLLGETAAMAILPPHPANYLIAEAREALEKAFVSRAQRDNALAEALEISKGMDSAEPSTQKAPRI